MAHLDDLVTVNPPRVAIIGGGYAGLAAAVTLSESACVTTLLDAGRTLGGRARRIDYRQETLDNGQHILSGAYTELLRLMQTVGVHASATVRTPLRLEMPPSFLLRAPRWPAPWHVLWALLTARGLGIADRFAAIRFMRYLEQKCFMVDSAQSVRALLAQQRQPERLVRYLWSPLTVSALNTPISSASAQVFANVLRDALASAREASDLLLPAVDLSAMFPDAAATWLRDKGTTVAAGTRVTAVKKDGLRFLVEASAAGQSPESRFDSVIIAIGPHQFDAIRLPESIAVPAFDYEAITTIYFKFAGPVRLPGPMLGQADGIAHWFFDRRQLGHRDSVNDGMIAAVISANGPHCELPAQELEDRVLLELRRLLPALPPPEWRKTVVEKFATFSCTPRMHAARPDTMTAAPGLFLAGDYVAGDYPATLEGAVRNGIRAANAAIEHLNRKSVK